MMNSPTEKQVIDALKQLYKDKAVETMFGLVMVCEALKKRGQTDIAIHLLKGSQSERVTRYAKYLRSVFTPKN